MKASRFSARPVRSASPRSTWLAAFPIAFAWWRWRRATISNCWPSRFDASVPSWFRSRRPSLRASSPTASDRSKVTILHGAEGAIAVATHPAAKLVMSAMVGALGLRPTLAAIKAGKDIAFANKEVLVVAGELVTRAAREQRRSAASGRQRAQRDLPVP